jgi:hypothetical protein
VFAGTVSSVLNPVLCLKQKLNRHIPSMAGLFSFRYVRILDLRMAESALGRTEVEHGGMSVKVIDHVVDKRRIGREYVSLPIQEVVGLFMDFASQELNKLFKLSWRAVRILPIIVQ